MSERRAHGNLWIFGAKWVSLITLVAVGSAAFVLNLGAGRLRAASPKFSLRWFLYVHLPVLAVVPLRQWFELNLWAVPFLVGISAMGQVCGSRMSRNN